MAVTPHQMDIKGAYIQDAYQALEDSLIEMIIKRIANNSFVELTDDNVFQWQLEKMRELHMMNMDTINELVGKTSQITKGQLKELITQQGYEFNAVANEALANIAGVEVAEWTNLDMVLEQYFDSQWLQLENHVNQTLISTNFNYNPITKAYQQVLNDTVTRTLAGFQTSEKAMKSAIYDMVEKGLSSSLIDKAGREWSLERYVRTVVKNTTRNVYNDLRTQRAIDQYNIVTALMSSHMAAREACSHIQGGFVLMVRKAEAPEEYQYLPSIYEYGYGDPAGTRGINCNHRFYSMLPMKETGIPKPPKAEEAQANAKIVAKQRRMEVAIRNAKKQLKAAEILDDKEGIDYFKTLIRQRQGALRQLINDNSILHRERGREQIYSGPSQNLIDAMKFQKGE